MYNWHVYFLENQQEIRENFKQLLSFGNRLFTLVLVIRNPNVHHDVSSEIDRTFRPSMHHQNKPIVIDFSVNKAKRFGVEVWANKDHVNRRIMQFLRNGTPFIFYYDGSFNDSNVFELNKYQKAIEEIFSLRIYTDLPVL